MLPFSYIFFSRKWKINKISYTELNQVFYVVLNLWRTVDGKVVLNDCGKKDPKYVLYFSYYLISSKFEAIDEIMAKVQDQFQEVKTKKTQNSSKEILHTKESLLIRVKGNISEG